MCFPQLMNPTPLKPLKPLSHEDSIFLESLINSERNQLFTLTLKNILQHEDRKKISNLIHLLDAFLKKNTTQIQNLCNKHYNLFIECIQELLSIKGQAQSLSTATIDLNNSLHQSGSQVLKSGKNILLQQKALKNIDKLLLRLHRVRYLLELAEKATSLYNSHKFYSSLKLCLLIRSTHIPQLLNLAQVNSQSEGHIQSHERVETETEAAKHQIPGTILPQWLKTFYLPNLIAKITKASILTFRDEWLVNIRKNTHTIGEMSILQYTSSPWIESQSSVLTGLNTENSEKTSPDIQPSSEKTTGQNSSTLSNPSTSAEIQPSESPLDASQTTIQTTLLKAQTVIQCVQIFQLLGQFEQFRAYYQSQRKLQLKLLKFSNQTPNPTPIQPLPIFFDTLKQKLSTSESKISPHLAILLEPLLPSQIPFVEYVNKPLVQSFQSFLFEIAGFFITEALIQQETRVIFFSTREAHSMWKNTISKVLFILQQLFLYGSTSHATSRPVPPPPQKSLKNRIKKTVPKPNKTRPPRPEFPFQLLIALKYVSVRFCKAMRKLNYPTDQLTDFFQDQFGLYNEQLTRALVKEFQYVLSLERYEPLEIPTKALYKQWISDFGLLPMDPHCKFPFQASFSITVPFFCKITTVYISNIMEYAIDLGLISSTDALWENFDSFISYVLTPMVTDQVDSTQNVHITQAILLAINMHHLHQNCQFFQQFISNIISVGKHFARFGPPFPELSWDDSSTIENIQLHFPDPSESTLFVNRLLANTVEQSKQLNSKPQYEFIPTFSKTILSGFTYHCFDKLLHITAKHFDTKAQPILTHSVYIIDQSRLASEDIILQVIVKKIEMFLSLASTVNWVDTAIPKQPHDFLLDLLAYLSVTFSLQPFQDLPIPIRKAVHNACFHHLSLGLCSQFFLTKALKKSRRFGRKIGGHSQTQNLTSSDVLSSTSTQNSLTAPIEPSYTTVDKFNQYSICQLWLDHKCLLDFASNTSFPIAPVISPFSQLLDFLTTKDPTEILDPDIRGMKYPLLPDLSDLVGLLQKFLVPVAADDVQQQELNQLSVEFPDISIWTNEKYVSCLKKLSSQI